MRRSNRQTDILIAPATRRHKTQTCVVAVAVSLFAAMTANAQLVIFDNIPSDYQFGGGGATIRGAGANPPLASISLAQQFTPTEDTVLGSVHLGLNGSQSGNYFDVDLFSGSGNGPDTHLASLGTAFGVSFACCFPADFNSQAFILNSTAEITLQAGVEYYIVVKAQLSTSQAAWATVTDTVGHWRDVGGTGWTFHDGIADKQLAMRIFSVPPTRIVGPPDAPIGISNLVIPYSGGIALFDVKFDERAFDATYETGVTGLPFTTDVDIAAAMHATGDYLHQSGAFQLGSSPTNDGQVNTRIYYPDAYDAMDVTRGYRVSLTPAGWTSREFESTLFARGQSFPNLGFDRHVWATFTPVRAESAVAVKTITVTHPGNAGDDPHGSYGSVDYVYDIGQFEITVGQYTEFLNAVAADDTYGLYNPDMWTEVRGCKIERTGISGNYHYSVASDWRDLPVNFVSWGDAVRFCNWMHNGQPAGIQDMTTTEDGSYFLNGAVTNEELIMVAREPDATWVLPTEDEWYKSAYHYNDGVTTNYWDFPTCSDTAPWSEIPPGVNMDNGSANFFGSEFAVGAPYYRTDVGAYDAKPSASPYGTFDQGGNVFEWSEGIAFTTSRVMRGGAFYSSSDDLRSWNRNSFSPANEWDGFGFRVAHTRILTSPCLVPEQLGSFQSGGQAKNVAIEGGIAYVANGDHGLLVVDVNDPTAPMHLSSPDMSTDAFDIRAIGTTIYITDLNLGLLIVDASTPTSPTLLGSFDVGGPAFGFSIQGTTAYVAAFLNGLEIIDASIPATPVSLGSVDGFGLATDVTVVGGIAYVTTFDQGLQILDVSDPANITMLGNYDTPGEAVSVAVDNGVAFVADGEAGLLAIDVSDPSEPWLISAYGTPGIAVNVAVEDATVYVADADAGLLLIDVSNPVLPDLASWYGTPGTATGVLVDETVVFIADNNFGLHIVDTEGNSAPEACDTACGGGRPLGDVTGDMNCTAFWRDYRY